MKRKALLITIPLALSLGLCGCNIQAEVSGDSGVPGTVQDNTSTQDDAVEAQQVNVEETFTVPDMFEITLHNAEWKDSLVSGDPNGTNITYGADEPSATYLVVNATVKNIGSSAESLTEGLNGTGNLGAAFKINDKYEIDASGVIPITGDRVGIERDIQPMMSAEVQFYASVSDEIKNSFENLELTLAARKPQDDGVWNLSDSPIGLYKANFQ